MTQKEIILNDLNSASDTIHFYSVDLVMLMGAWDTG
jgi:hypothetical protein